MKPEIKKNEIIKISVIAALALLLLFAVYKVFYTESSDSKSCYTQEETRLCNILSEIEGVGEVSVIINSTEDGAGVVVVCEGADDLLGSFRNTSSGAHSYRRRYKRYNDI